MENHNDTSAERGGGSLERMVRRITDKWEELDENCEYRNLPRERMEAMLTAELSAMISEYETAYKRLHSQVSGYLHGKEWEHWQKYNEPRYAPNEKAEALCPDKDQKL